MTLYLLHFPSFVSLIFEGNSINKKSFSQETNNKIEKIRGFYSYIILFLQFPFFSVVGSVAKETPRMRLKRIINSLIAVDWWLSWSPRRGGQVEIISHLPLISFLTVSQGYEGLEPNRCGQPSFSQQSFQLWHATYRQPVTVSSRLPYGLRGRI